MATVSPGIPMEQALSPEECGRVRQFFATLLKFHDQYKRIPVMKFMNAYRTATTGYKREFNHGFWTDERVDEVKRMRDGGAKWSEIEKRFNKTRQAVVEAYRRRGGYYAG